jgi:hypothetical protein
MDNQNEDKEFELILADKRHKEMLSTLKGVVYALDKKDNSDIVLAIEKQQEIIGNALIELKNKEKSPDIVINQDNLVISIRELADSLLNSLNEIKVLVNKEEPKEWQFKIKRNNFSDLIESVSVIKK